VEWLLVALAASVALNVWQSWAWCQFRREVGIAVGQYQRLVPVHRLDDLPEYPRTEITRPSE